MKRRLLCFPEHCALLICKFSLFWSAAHSTDFPLSLREDGVPQGCTEHFLQQPLDHWSTSGEKAGSIHQRYLLCGTNGASDGPIFLYTGNEAPVDLYARFMGQLWEMSSRFGAMLVFAEHRFFGKSTSVRATSISETRGSQSVVGGEHLSPQQAVLDFASLIAHLQSKRPKSQGTVVFGGSYGGVLAAMLRQQRPDLVLGAVASSAPLELWQPWFNPELLARAETHTTVRLGGRQCADRFHRAAAVAWQLGHGSSDDKEVLRRSLALCKVLETKAMPTLLQRFRDAITTLSMASYPQTSSFFTGGRGNLPAYPLREACAKINASSLSTPLDGLKSTLMMYYNASGDLSCFDPDRPVEGATGNLYGFLRCGSLHYADVGSDGRHDMFWPQPYDASVDQSICLKQWNHLPKPTCCKKEIEGLWNITNLALSIGELDPWRATAPKPASMPRGATWRLIKMAGHHVDLMAGGPEDPSDIRAARSWMSNQVASWLGHKALQNQLLQPTVSSQRQMSKSLRRVRNL